MINTEREFSGECMFVLSCMSCFYSYLCVVCNINAYVYCWYIEWMLYDCSKFYFICFC